MEEKIITAPSEQKETEQDESRSSPADSSPAGETASATPAPSTEVPKTLEEALNNIRELHQQEEAAKWGQGEQVNNIEDARLAVREGYKSARECLKQKLPELKPATIRAYALVAKHYSQEHSRRWGVAKLQKLVAIQNGAHGTVLPGDPADHEVHIPRADGKLIAKKFSDCTLRELYSAARHQKEARTNAGQVVDKDAKQPAPESTPSSLMAFRALGIMGIGAVGGIVGSLLWPSQLGSWICVLSLLIGLGGAAELFRYFVAIRNRFFAALKSGEGLRILKEEAKDVLSKGRNFVAVLKSMRSKSKTTATTEETSPPQKKAA